MTSNRSRTSVSATTGAPKGPTQRQRRVAEEIRHTLSLIFSRGELSDPDLANHSLTLTRVTLSPDLKTAKVFFIPLGLSIEAEDLKALVKSLNKSASEIRHLLDQQMNLRFSPALKFYNDDTFEQAQRIDDLLYQARQRDAKPSGDE